MLVLRKLVLQDFGPFKGTQSIDFPAVGVAQLHGDNGRGKTSLLAAIKYAFFGHLPPPEDGASRLRMENVEAVDEGRRGFKVVLAFEHGGKEYELTREVRVTKGVLQPMSDVDFDQEVYLRRGGKVFKSGEQTKHEISRIMPEQVSRFFLFDGELLQQYTELLRSESDQGRLLKEAIERILGVPILTNASVDVEDGLRHAQAQEAKALQQNTKTKELGNQLSDLLSQRTHLQGEVKKRKAEIEQMTSRKAGLEERLRKVARISAQLEEKARHEERVKLIEDRLKKRRAELRESMSRGWTSILTPQLTGLRRKIDDDIEAINEARHLAVGAEYREKARKTGKCPICSSKVDLAKLRKVGDEKTAIDLEKEHSQLTARRQRLESLQSGTSIEQAVSTLTEIDEDTVELADLNRRISDLEDQVGSEPAAEVEKLQGDYATTSEALVLAKKGQIADEQAVEDMTAKIRKIEDKRDKEGDTDVAGEKRRRELYQRLSTLFKEGIAQYRNELRGKVEKNATEIFLLLRHEPDYVALKINENYGLTIMHRDGREVPVRSAGQEQIVALALMAALQHNAPLKGPIIMDTSLARLDPTHRQNLIRALPQMAEQAVLLTHDGEIKPQQVKEELKGKLKVVKKLARRSARYTLLEG